jgi:hypothetical protein
VPVRRHPSTIGRNFEIRATRQRGRSAGAIDPAKLPLTRKVRAADSILDHSAKAIELEDIEARVAELERAAQAAKRSRGEGSSATTGASSMRTTQIHRRLDLLASTFRPGGKRSFTLEELCRLYWNTNQRGFRALVAGECSGLRVFVDMFEREDAERQASGQARK